MFRLEIPDRLASADPARVSGRWSVPVWLVSLVLHAGIAALLLVTLPPIARGLQSPDIEDAREVGIILRSEKDEHVIFENANERFETPAAESDLTPSQIDEMPTPMADSKSPEPLPRLDPSILGTAGSGAAASAPAQAHSEAEGGSSRTTFWKVPTIGKSFVFVIDRSASMSHRGSLDWAKKELLQALEQLSEKSLFQIVFYNTDASLLSFGEGQLIEASPTNIARAKKEIDRILPEGGTQHVKPLLMAFQLKPEVIYFLTDADMLSLEEIATLTAANRQARIPATVVAIEFGSGPNLSNNKPLRKLAADNDGTYSYLDVQEFGSSLGRPEDP